MKSPHEKRPRATRAVLEYDGDVVAESETRHPLTGSRADRAEAPELETARTAWILGDWVGLARYQDAALDDRPDRELLALLIGSACMQLGQVEKGRSLIERARMWGCPTAVIAQILVAGVHLTLGRAELLRNESMRSRQHVLAAIGSISRKRPDARSGPRRLARKAGDLTGTIPTIALDELGRKLRSNLPPPAPSASTWRDWEMTKDDGPILRYLFAAHQPRRHLEFGTWRGWGTCLCLETTAATVWTINLPDGETKSDGSWAYGERIFGDAPQGPVELRFGQDAAGPIVYHRTDAGSYIGWLYRKKKLAHRVCQILCDSRQWDHTAYPADFFDSVFIDGGHQTDVVISDTRKALSVLRPGGMIIWHDFCPLQEVREASGVVGEVSSILEVLLPELASLFSQLAWINPSMILIGIRK